MNPINFLRRFAVGGLCALLLSHSLLFHPTSVSAEDSADAPNTIQAQSYCLMDAEDQSILCQKNASLPLPMASTTKIMTALVIIESCDVNESVSVSPQAAGTEGSSVYLQAGEKLTVKDLLYALMLESANDAAMALALFCCETVEEFADKMNQKAKEIGMKNASFRNPSGLSEEGHCAGAADMALLMACAMKNPLFREITATKNVRIPMENKEEYRYLSNHNRLLKKYPHCIGGKTGYTIAAGRCLVSVSEKEGVMLIAVTLNDRNDWNDHIDLYEYGFSLYKPTPLCRAGELTYSVPVVGGRESRVILSNQESLTLPLRSGEGIEVRWELPFFLYAPIVASRKDSNNILIPTGQAVFIQNGRVLAQIWLYPTQSIAEYVPPTWWERILSFFGRKE